MSKESIGPNFRGEDVTIEQARQIVWGAGNMALGKDLEHRNKQIIAEELGRMFGKIDEVEELAEIAKDEMPGAGEVTFTFGSIMMSMDYRKNLIYQREQQLHDGPLNPFAIHDDELPAIESLSLYIETAYNEVIE